MVLQLYNYKLTRFFTRNAFAYLLCPLALAHTTTDFDPKSQLMARLAHELKLAKEELAALKARGVGSGGGIGGGSSGGGGSGNAKGGRMGSRRQSAEEMVGIAQLREMTADVRLRLVTVSLVILTAILLRTLYP